MLFRADPQERGVSPIYVSACFWSWEVCQHNKPPTQGLRALWCLSLMARWRPATAPAPEPGSARAQRRGRDEAARPLEVGCRRDAPAWVTQHLASGASAGVRRRASSDETIGRRGHAPGAAGGALAEALPGGRRGASTLWTMATPGGALPEGFGSLCRTAAAKTQAFYRRVSPPGCGPSPWRVGPCLRSSARGTGQRRRRCRTSTRKASPARCGPWPRRAGACSRSSSHCAGRDFLHGSAPDAAGLGSQPLRRRGRPRA